LLVPALLPQFFGASAGILAPLGQNLSGLVGHVLDVVDDEEDNQPNKTSTKQIVHYAEKAGRLCYFLM
jgi:hypothetical protein